MPRRRAKKTTKKTRALANPLPDVQPVGDAVYVRVPVSAEDAATIQGHVQTGAELVERGRSLLASFLSFVNDVDRDISRRARR